MAAKWSSVLTSSVSWSVTLGLSLKIMTYSARKTARMRAMTPSRVVFSRRCGVSLTMLAGRAMVSVGFGLGGAA